MQAKFSRQQEPAAAASTSGDPAGPTPVVAPTPQQLQSPKRPPSRKLMNGAAGVSTAPPASDTTGVCGTSYYISPEIVNGWASYDEKVDLFSLGVVVFELWHPFETAMERVVMLSALRDSGKLPETWAQTHPKASASTLYMIKHAQFLLTLRPCSFTTALLCGYPRCCFGIAMKEDVKGCVVLVTRDATFVSWAPVKALGPRPVRSSFDRSVKGAILATSCCQQVADLIRLLMAPNPADRPSAREVLRGELLPPRVEDEQLEVCGHGCVGMGGICAVVNIHTLFLSKCPLYNFLGLGTRHMVRVWAYLSKGKEGRWS